MDKTDTAVAGLIEKFDVLATQYGSEMFSAAMTAYSLEGYRNLFWGSLLTLAALILSVAAFHFYKRGRAGDADEMDGLGYYIAAGAAAIVGLPFWVEGLYRVADIWNWVAVTNPEIAAAHKILGI